MTLDRPIDTVPALWNRARRDERLAGTADVADAADAWLQAADWFDDVPCERCGVGCQPEQLRDGVCSACTFAVRRSHEHQCTYCGAPSDRPSCPRCDAELADHEKWVAGDPRYR